MKNAVRLLAFIVMLFNSLFVAGCGEKDVEVLNEECKEHGFFTKGDLPEYCKYEKERFKFYMGVAIEDFLNTYAANDSAFSLKDDLLIYLYGSKSFIYSKNKIGGDILWSDYCESYIKLNEEQIKNIDSLEKKLIAESAEKPVTGEYMGRLLLWRGKYGASKNKHFDFIIVSNIYYSPRSEQDYYAYLKDLYAGRCRGDEIRVKKKIELLKCWEKKEKNPELHCGPLNND